jgi:hypothetical protein
MMEPDKPSLRKPFGVFLLMAYITAYVVAAVIVAEPVMQLPALAQAPIWLLVGVAWVLPLRPLLRWIELGRFGR